MTLTWYLQAAAVSAVVVLVVVLGVRTVLVERAAGTGVHGGPGWTRPRSVRRLDVAATVLAVVSVGVLLTTVLAGVLAWG